VQLKEHHYLPTVSLLL